ncbi:MAG: hypothetical protein ACRDOI_03470 [Trebonia sp.]
MSARPIIDAGPGLNFLSVNNSRFRAAATAWRKFTPRWIQILSDDATPELAAVVRRISGSSLDERKRQSKDLGETRVIAHAVVAAESGQSVTVLMDDGPGAKIATLEVNRLGRLRSSGRPVGSIILASTLTVLGRAVDTEQPVKRTLVLNAESTSPWGAASALTRVARRPSAWMRQRRAA